MVTSEKTKIDEVLIRKLNERLACRGSDKGIEHFIDISKKLGSSLYEVLCEIEKALTFNDLAEVFCECSGIKLSTKLEGDVLKATNHFIETTEAIYIWHFVSLDAVAANGKQVYIVPKNVFDSYSVTESPGGTINFQNTREWFVQKILMPAIKINATDIHIVPRITTGSYKIFFRVLGDLSDIATISTSHGEGIVSMLIYWAKEFSPSLRIDDLRRPQDARIEIEKEQVGVPIDMRLSFIPKQNLKDVDVVIRLLYKISISEESLQGLGFLDRHVKLLTDVSMKNKGIVLVTGATGAGKSRTINTILSKISPTRNVLTVEDPVEYILPNARQFQTFEWESVEGKKNAVDFGDFARAFKRHDPDVIFIGELRDKVTANTAFHLSKTGHLVFATLHASRATIVPGMLHYDYGISIDEIADNLILATNQVLVRKLCPRCSDKEIFTKPYWFSLLPYANVDEVVKRLEGQMVHAPRKDHIDQGCACTVRYGKTIVSTGYIGRIVLTECIVFSPDMFVDGNISVTAMDKKTAQSSNILDDAVEKLLKGVIDVEELRKLI